MIYLKSESEIEKMRESALIVSRTLGLVARYIEPGVSTARLNGIAEEFIEGEGGEPVFKGYGPKGNPFPAALCISINEEVVHGIPSEDRVLDEGDIVSVDCGVVKNGYVGDHAYTFPVGEVDEESRRLLQVTRESLEKAIDQAVHGNRVGDISHAVQSHCEDAGFGVVRDLVGHGLGRSLHEDPSVPNFGRKGRGERLRSGMTLAIEPMITAGSWKVRTLEDGWTVVTADGSRAAHFEHDVVIRDGEADILSTFDYIDGIAKRRINTEIANG
ncbi:MAG: type I methionyl aminopeptidase [Balneolaceae bacterium]|nr:type I methionyl aminopeptidase [Balneolaceae bacterium]